MTHRSLQQLVLTGVSALSICAASSSLALEYPYNTIEPQKTGWPLSEEALQYVKKAEFERRPGSDKGQHLPKLWPAVPSAGFWRGTTWLDTHEKLVKYVQTNKGPIDILLVGDSITQQWGSPLDGKPFNAAWQKAFGKLKTVNIGIGGDKIQNILWRLDHEGVAGLEPRLIILMAGNNNMFFTPETGVDAAAQGVKMCLNNLREKFPTASVIVVKILPAHTPGNPFYEDIKKTNVALDALKLETDPKVHLLDLTADFTTVNGELKPTLFESDNVHLTQNSGYGLYAEKLQPIVSNLLK